jgi:hypothetical protein
MHCQVRISPEDYRQAELKLEDGTVLILSIYSWYFPGTSLRQRLLSICEEEDQQVLDILNAMAAEIQKDIDAEVTGSL